MEAVDLRHVPVVDNHCHGILRSQNFDDLASWRQAFTESADPGMPREHVGSTAFYRRLIRTLAEFFGCEPEEEAVLTVRAQRDPPELTAELLRAANIETLLIDTGYPPPEEVLREAELAQRGNCRTGQMGRLERLMERLVAEPGPPEEAKEALTAARYDGRGQG